MKLQDLGGVCFWIAMASAVAAAQQPVGRTEQPSQPAASVVERTYPSGGVTPSRRAQTRTASDRGEVVTEILEMPGLDGELEPVGRIRTETVRTGPNTERSRQDRFGVGTGRELILLERTESDRDVSTAGNARAVATTWAADLNGRLVLKSRQIEQTSSNPDGIHESTTTLLRPDINEPSRGSERMESTEGQVGASVVRHEITELVRDLNGRWQITETRSVDSRRLVPSGLLDEETILQPDRNGQLTVSERIITRRSGTDGRGDVLMEIYAPNAEGFARSDGRLAMSQRVRTSTTRTADGGSVSLEEVEARNPLEPADGMRVIRRTEVRVRSIGPDRWATERRVFERDVNGRMAPILTEMETAGARP